MAANACLRRRSKRTLKDQREDNFPFVEQTPALANLPASSVVYSINGHEKDVLESTVVLLDIDSHPRHGRARG